MKASFFSTATISILWCALSASGLQAAAVSVAGDLPQVEVGSEFVCRDELRGRLKNPDVLNIGIALGYSDKIDEGMDLVTDLVVRDRLGQRFLRRCTDDSSNLCDFKKVFPDTEVVEDVDHFSRELIFQDGQTMTIHIYLTNSSFSVLNSENQTRYEAEQARKSRNARDFYGWALRNLDVIFYEGHSRDGGGPDFAPPLPASTGKVNYPWYRKNGPGLKLLLEELRFAQRNPLALGFFSCASRRHFLKKLKRQVPFSTLILTPVVVAPEKPQAALEGSLESLVNFECVSELRARLLPFDFLVDYQRTP
jgi:hypothetical protein